ncbi:MAG: PaaI family thioesterase [Bacteroidota bacterium]
MTALHLAKLERMYLTAKVNTSIYPSTAIEIGNESAEIVMEITPDYHHALGSIHGSVYFKMLDDAAFFAVSSIVKDVFVLTQNFNIQFHRPVSDGKIIAKGQVRLKSRDFFFAEATLFNEQGKELAVGSGNFVKSKTLLTADIGYK